MIKEYHRPQTIDDALALLSRPNVRSVLAGGGTTLHRLDGETVEIIDLQALNLNQIEQQGNWVTAPGLVAKILSVNPRCP